MFGRRRSPRDDLKGRERRAQSSTAFQQNGHRRQDSDGELEVRNFEYGNPDHGGAPRARAVTSPTTDFQPQLGRNTSGAEDVESAVYVTPADTLNRGTPSSIIHQSSKPVSSNPGGSSGFSESFSGSRSEMRNMQLHQLTLSQVSKRNQGGSENSAPGPSPAGGGQRIQMNEGSDYSVPFNLLQEGSGRSGGDGRRPRSKPPVPPDNSECIIPICPPSSSPQSPSDRSDTTSPNSPRSNQSSEHEQHPPPPPPSSQRPPDEGDYAVPWDRSRLFQNLSRGSVSSNRRPRRREDLDDSVSGTGPSRSRGGSLRDQPSPPAPLPPSRYPQQDINQVPPPPPPEASPPPPELPYDPNRPWRNRAVSDRIQEGSSLARSHSRPAVLAGDDVVGGTRTQSMSAHVSAGKRNNSRRCSTPPIVDPSIPLEDQPWYHGHLTRAEAEDKLRDQSDFSFLVRKSESCQTDFSLSIKDLATGCIHLRMVYEEDPSPGYVLGQFSRHFDKVADCIAFYMKQRLNIRGAEHKRLNYPVPRTHAGLQNSLARVGV